MHSQLKIYLLLAAFFGGLFLLMWEASAVAVPFLLSLLLAYFLDPAVDLLEKRLPRGLAVLAVFALFVLVVGVLLVFLIPTVKTEVLFVQQALPRYAEGLYRLLPSRLLESLGITGNQDLQSLLHRLLQGVRSLSFDVVNQVALFVSHAFSSTFGFLLAVLGYFIIPIYLFYLLKDFDRLKAGVVSLVPERYRSTFVDIGQEIDGVLSSFLRGQLTVCLILGALYSIGLLVIGIDLALVIGIVSGIAFIIPYLGFILGVSIASVLAVAKFHDVLHPLMVIGWFGLVQSLEGTVITPRIVGD
ncbi:MAG TPA: AI-2E family transporter, partial [Desulfuromonadales bacterium]|nr:AI-2E family transporter [Desulfuromonadales bacterium]